MSDLRTTTNDCYEEYWSAVSSCPRAHLSPELAKLLDRSIPRSRRCMDIGCGHGHTASRLYQAAERCWSSLLGFNLYALAFKRGD